MKAFPAEGNASAITFISLLLTLIFMASVNLGAKTSSFQEIIADDFRCYFSFAVIRLG